MTLYTHKDSNIRKTWLLFTAFLLVVIGLGWFFSRVYSAPAILFFAVFFSSLMSFISYWYSDKIVIRIAKARLIEKKDIPELYNIVENLSITAGLPMPKIYLIDDLAPNAFATGRNPEHAVVTVTSGLLEKMEKAELEGVLAHELSHIGNRDMLFSTVVVVLVGFIALLSDMFLRSTLWRSFGSRDRQEGQAGAILALLGIVLAMLSPLIAMLIQLAISRKREFLADASGALLTRYPEGLASALEKIGRYSRPMRNANKAMAHLFIANPFSAKNISKLFMSHPPIEERVKILRAMNI